MPKNRYLIRGIFWIIVYLALTAAPLFVVLIGPTPPGRGFWVEFSVALGFVGLAMMGLQFGLTGRFRYITTPIGIVVVYKIKRQISLVAFGLVLAHPIILFIINPDTLALLNPITAPWRARFGVGAVVALAVLVGLSLWRLRLRIRYETWRLSHGLLATAAVLLAMLHILGVSHYMAEPWKQVFWMILTVIWIGLLVYIRLIKPFLMIRRPYRVEKVIRERGDAWTIVLTPDGHDGIRFQPGQFAWLTLWNSPFNITEHPFSLTSSAENPRELHFTIKKLGDFTATIEQIPAGKRAYLDGPYGAFSIDRQPNSLYVLIAGGIGITPLMSMLRTAADRQDKRRFILIYANSTWDDVTFRVELEQLTKQLDLKVIHVLENPPDDWQGEEGYVTGEIIRRHVPDDLSQHDYFICGPDPMIEAVENALEALDVPLTRIHAERYNLV